MKQYLGVKLISAEPMNKYEFWMNLKGVDCTEDNEEGYKVVYEDGYTSWSPKKVFEIAYREIKLLEDLSLTKELLPHQQRVHVEAVDLDTKIKALYTFILENPIYTTLPPEEQDRLVKQAQAMQYYFGILIERINNF